MLRFYDYDGTPIEDEDYYEESYVIFIEGKDGMEEFVDFLNSLAPSHRDQFSKIDGEGMWVYAEFVDKFVSEEDLNLMMTSLARSYRTLNEEKVRAAK